MVTVGTTTTANATRLPPQRKIFYANGRFWAFYSNGTDCVWRTSTNGAAWSAETVVKAGLQDGVSLSIWFDGTYLHYAGLEADFPGSTKILYRRGTPEPDGTVTWSAAEQTAVDEFFMTAYDIPVIAVDSAGYPWVGYTNIAIAADKETLKVTKSSNNDGTWATAGGFPHVVNNNDSFWACSIAPLTDQKVYLVYGARHPNPAKPNEFDNLRGKLWDGAWGAEENITTSAIYSSYGHSSAAEGDDVHVVVLKETSYDILYVKRTDGVGWGAEETVQAATTVDSRPVLSYDPPTGDLYCFWASSPTADHIYYKKKVGANWDVDPTDWIDESADDLATPGSLTCYYSALNSYLGLLYVAKTGSPYDVRHDYLSAGIGADEMMAAISGGGGGGGGGSGDIQAHSRKPPEAVAY